MWDLKFTMLQFRNFSDFLWFWNRLKFSFIVRFKGLSNYFLRKIIYKYLSRTFDLLLKGQQISEWLKFQWNSGACLSIDLNDILWGLATLQSSELEKAFSFKFRKNGTARFLHVFKMYLIWENIWCHFFFSSPIFRNITYILF